jgi:hypothetical protein
MTDFVKKLQVKPDFYSLSGASGALIEEAEKILKLRFSDEYRQYLAAFGVASANGHEFTGICASSRLNVIDVTVFERTSNPEIPMNWYVVEQANIDDIVIWQSGTGEVYQSAPNTVPVKLCESLCDYIEL